MIDSCCRWILLLQCCVINKRFIYTKITSEWNAWPQRYENLFHFCEKDATNMSQNSPEMSCYGKKQCSKYTKTFNTITVVNIMNMNMYTRIAMSPMGDTDTLVINLFFEWPCKNNYAISHWSVLPRQCLTMKLKPILSLPHSTYTLQFTQAPGNTQSYPISPTNCCVVNVLVNL